MFEDTVMLLVSLIRRLHPVASVVRVGSASSMEGIQDVLEGVGANFTSGEPLDVAAWRGECGVHPPACDVAAMRCHVCRPFLGTHLGLASSAWVLVPSPQISGIAQLHFLVTLPSDIAQ